MPTVEEKFDIIIIGTGLSASCFIYELIEKLEIKINLLWIGPLDTRAQTVCTWEPKSSDPWYKDFIQQKWNSWYFKFDNETISHASINYNYIAIDAQLLRKKAMSKIADFNWITRDTSSVLDVSRDNGVFTIKTPERSFLAEDVIDTRPPDYQKDSILQHFYGLKLRAKSRDFRSFPKDVCLMDFDINQEDPTGPCFIYALPFSNSEILIETTFFSKMIKNKVSYISQIRTWLKSRHNLELDDYEIIESEHGVIPMGKIIPIDDSLARLGSAGYATKTSTGYTFEYILKQTKSIIDQIHQKQHLTTYNPHPKPLAALDYIFLKVVNDNPSLMPRIFMHMAQKLKPDTFVEFMSEKNTFLTSFKMIMAMPKIPFIRSLLKIGLKRNV